MELSNLKLPKTFEDYKNRLGLDDLAQWSGAVNFLFVEDRVVLIKRSNTMPSHRGQIAFFGGHKNPDETEPLETAKRELAEESEINLNKIQYFGLHEPVKTSRARMIIPALCRYEGTLEEFKVQVRSNGEWDNLVFVKLDALREKTLWTKGKANSLAGAYEVFFFPLLDEFSHYWQQNDNAPYTLWGASAKMILNFFKNPNLDDKFL